MPSPSNPTRLRLIEAAIQLFATQGVTSTTTKQIAEVADVNEVTLFRLFGNKQGLLLAVLEEAAVFDQIAQVLTASGHLSQPWEQVLMDYAAGCLDVMERVPEVIRSVIGEAGQFSPENRVALGRGFNRTHQQVAQFWQQVIDREGLATHLSPEQFASLLNSLLLGYGVLELSCEALQLWADREDFLDSLLTLFLQGTVATSTAEFSAPRLATLASPASLSNASLPDATSPHEIVQDLAAEDVHQILRTAKKTGLQDYALAYVLFAAGLTAQELVGLLRSQYVHNSNQQILQILGGSNRQVPINQWILGKRLGSYTRNPLTQWLRSRKDENPALFLNSPETALSESELEQKWLTWTAGLTQPNGQSLAIAQTQQTWCVEMLGRGMTADELSILTGLDTWQLQPYVNRAREKAVLEQAMRLDQKG